MEKEIKRDYYLDQLIRRKDNGLIKINADRCPNLMKELGCVNAMNLDGGGSTVMFVKGQVVNKPAVQGGIPLSHTLTVRKIS